MRSVDPTTSTVYTDLFKRDYAYSSVMTGHAQLRTAQVRYDSTRHLLLVSVCFWEAQQMCEHVIACVGLRDLR